MRKQLDKPSLMLDFFIEDSSSQIVGSRILPERKIAYGAPTADRATLGFKQQCQDTYYSRRVGQFGCRTPGLVMKLSQVVRQTSAKLINPRNDQLPMRPIFEARVFTNFFVILIARKVH